MLSHRLAGLLVTSATVAVRLSSFSIMVLYRSSCTALSCSNARIRSKNSLCVSPALSIRFSNASTRASVMHSCGLFVHWFSIGKWGGLTRPVTSFLISPAGTRFQSAGSCTSYFPFQLSPVFLYCHAISNTVIAPPRHSRDKIHVRAELLFLRRFRLRFRRSGGRRNIHQHAVLNRQLAVRAVIRAQGSRLTGTATHSVLVRGGGCASVW